MPALWECLDAFRFVGSPKHAPAHFHRDHLVLLFMQNEKRSRDRADIPLKIVLISDQQAKRQPEINRPRATSIVEVSGASSTTLEIGRFAASRTA